MKRFLCLVLCLFVLQLPVLAQGRHHGGKLQARLAQLNLSADQQQRVQQLLAQGGDKRQLRQQIGQILTPEQRQQWKAMRHKNGRHQGKPGAQPGTQGEVG